jgi:predicted exporter
METLRRRFWLWLGAVAMLGAAYGFGVHGRLQVETDLLAMLPQVERDPLVEGAVRALAEATGRRTLFLVGAPDLARARAAAADLATTLTQGGAFDRVTFRVELDAAAIDALYAPHRAVLLSDSHRAWLAAGEAARLGEEAQRALYTPAGWLRVRTFADDPLNLYGDFLAQQLPLAGALQLQGDVLIAPSPAGPYVVVTAESAAAFSLQGNAQLEAAIVDAIAQVEARHADSDVLCSGVVRHAAAAAASGKAEVALFGSLSLAAIALLIAGVFRGVRPLLLTFVSLGVGTLAAITACHFLFGRVHLLTLVFGSTLTGVGVDYSLHYFADQFRHRNQWDPRDTLRHVGPAVLVGMLATAAGYLALLLLPFPGLQQMAVFSIVGIAGACATVLLAYPAFANRRPASHAPAALALAGRLGALTAARRLTVPPAVALIVLAAIGGVGAWHVAFVDDVRALQSTPDWLKAEDAETRMLLGGAQDTRFFLVEGVSAEAALQAEEALREELNALVARGALAGYQALTRALPSIKRQREHHAWLAGQVYDPDGVLPRTLREIGYAPPEIARRLAEFPAEAPLLAPADWLASPASATLRGLWLRETSGPLGRGYATVVSLAGVRDVAALQALDHALPDVQFVDRVARISELLRTFRHWTALGLLGAFALVALALMWRYGAAIGLRLVIAPVGGAALTLATLAALGVPANLFNVLALLLVLGMGVDYAVFMREAGGARATVIMAILLAGLMTLLSFGLLALSATPFIRSLGLTVALGVSFTFVLALLSSAERTRAA